MIQFSRFSNGNYVLHNVIVNGHKYSVWYGKDGKPFSAERHNRDGNTVTVSSAQRKVWEELEKIGKPYKEQPHA